MRHPSHYGDTFLLVRETNPAMKREYPVQLPLRDDVLEYSARGRVLEVRKVRGPRYFMKLQGGRRAVFVDYADEARESVEHFLQTGVLL